MSKTRKIVKMDGPAEGLLGPRRVPYKRGEPVEVPAELAEAVCSQEGSGWSYAEKAGGKKAKEE